MPGVLFLLGFFLLVFGTYIPEILGPGNGSLMVAAVAFGLAGMVSAILLEMRKK